MAGAACARPAIRAALGRLARTRSGILNERGKSGFRSGNCRYRFRLNAALHVGGSHHAGASELDASGDPAGICALGRGSSSLPQSGTREVLVAPGSTSIAASVLRPRTVVQPDACQDNLDIAVRRG